MVMLLQMKRFHIPYGSSSLELDLDLDAELIASHGEWHRACMEPAILVRDALRHPLGTARLKEIIARKEEPEIVIVVDDHTRAAPTELMLDALLDELGDENADRTTVLIACGTHEPPSPADITRILGSHADTFRVVVHSCDDPDLKYVGRTSYGTPVWLNKTYVDADIRVLTGDITLHYYAGFGGGRKSILPGIAGRETIKKNHALLIHEEARTANLNGNPVHLDMTEAASFAPPDFVLNVVDGGDGTLSAAYAGAMEAVFEEGCARAQQLFCRQIPRHYELLLVSAGGFPHDRNLYQASKAIEHCYRAVAPGGNLVLVAECREGIGDTHFETWMDVYPSLHATEEAIRSNFVLGGHKAYYMRKVLSRIGLSIVSELSPERLACWQIKGFRSLEEALQGARPPVGIVPNGMDILLVPVSNI